jgi:hypothetical protein
MTETTADQTPTLTEVLVRHAFYQRFGVTYIAISDTTLQNLTGSDIIAVTPQEVTLIEAPGSPEWVDRMVRIRTSLIHTYPATQRTLDEQIDYIKRLGEALLQEANDRDWCGEYDTFAEEWGLPKRTSEWEVTMTVRVTARNEDDAVELVKDGVSINTYDGPVIHGPEFYASEM